MADDIPYHPLANIFPLMDGVAFRNLVEDMRVHGLREPIVLFDGAVLDGRNRLRACHAAQVAARFKTYDGKDALAFVISANLHRRHLDVSQRALIAANISEKRSGGWHRGPSTKVGGKVAQRPRPERYRQRQDPAKISCSQAANLMNVSPSTVTDAHKVLKRGVPELVRAVERGDVAVSAASTIATFDAGQQRNILSSGTKTVTVIAREEKKAAARAAPSAGKGRVPSSSPYHTFRLGDGRAIGNVTIGECGGLERLLQVAALVLAAVRGHVANPNPSAKVSDLIAAPKLDEMIQAARDQVSQIHSGDSRSA